MRLIRATQRAYERKFTFLIIVLAVLIMYIFLLSSVDLLPDTRVSVYKKTEVTLKTTPLVAATNQAFSKKINKGIRVLPKSIKIPSIGLFVSVSNPNTTNIKLLDKALLNGAVRYPLSAPLGVSGNVIIFGHSSYLPIVYNQVYKTFNGIQKLKQGEKVFVSSEKVTYVYSVDKVSKESAKSGAIPLLVSGSILTLSTCNSFGTKSDRFVVVAHLVGSYPNRD